MTLAERKIMILKCRAYFFSTMGAIVKGIRVMWWPAVEVPLLIDQVCSHQPKDILAGYMSEDRGLHWRRRND
jgi:hypothetical protein